jgi:hypothetical protein
VLNIEVPCLDNHSADSLSRVPLHQDPLLRAAGAITR